jgi:hypothetical protein
LRDQPTNELLSPPTYEPGATIDFLGQTFTVLFPDLTRPLTRKEYTGLVQDVKAKGVLVDIVVDENYNLIDGIHRLSAAVAAGCEEIPFNMVQGLSPQEKWELAQRLNAHRRHLDIDSLKTLRKQRITEVMQLRTQGLTYREIAKRTGSSTTRVRQDYAQAIKQGCLTENSPVTGKDGKSYPSTRKPRSKAVEQGCLTDSDKLLACFTAVRNQLRSTQKDIGVLRLAVTALDSDKRIIFDSLLTEITSVIASVNKEFARKKSQDRHQTLCPES